MPPDKPTHRAICSGYLLEMVQLGIALLRTVDLRNADLQMDGRNPIPETAIAFERISRAVRRTMMLADKFNEPGPIAAPNTPRQAKPPAPETDTPEPPDHPDHPDHPETDPIEPAIEPPEAHDDEQSLADELRLDRPESEDDEPDGALLHLPPEHQVAIIALDLRKTPNLEIDVDPQLDPPLAKKPRRRPAPKQPTRPHPKGYPAHTNVIIPEPLRKPRR